MGCVAFVVGLNGEFVQDDDDDDDDEDDDASTELFTKKLAVGSATGLAGVPRVSISDSMLDMSHFLGGFTHLGLTKGGIGRGDAWPTAASLGDATMGTMWDDGILCWSRLKQAERKKISYILALNPTVFH